MNTTLLPLWVPLVVAVIGVVGAAGGTIVGVLIAQRAARQREEAQRTYELERERARWSREDQLRNLQDRKLIVEDILAGTQALVEYHNDHFPDGVPDRFMDRAELQEMFRRLTRADRRGGVYFSPETIELVGEERRYWQNLIDLLDKPDSERRKARLHLMHDHSKRRKNLNAALQREAGQVDI